MRRLLLVLLLAPALAGAIPSPSLLPSGVLLAGSEDARYTVAPDGEIAPQGGLLSFYPEGRRPLWPEIQAPTWTAQGRLVVALVALSDPLEELEARVLSGVGEQVSRARGFELPAAALGREEPLAAIGGAPDPASAPLPAPPAPSAEDEPVIVYALLLGVPSDAATEPCELHIQGRAGERRFVRVSRLDVFPSDFVESRVVLSGELTALRTRTDARARADQQRLDRATSTFTPSAVHHLDALRPPLPLSPLSAGYGDRRVYLYADGSTARSTHRGLDVALPAGTRVAACARGTVILAADLVLTGRTVVVEHLPGLLSYYFHLSRIQVQEGALVEAGDTLGFVGSTGLATGAHLHWEIRSAGVAVDPRWLLGQALVDKAAAIRIIAAYRIQQQRR